MLNKKCNFTPCINKIDEEAAMCDFQFASFLKKRYFHKLKKKLKKFTWILKNQ